MSMDDTGAYAAHEMLVRPARARPELWRLVAGLVLATVLAFAMTAGFHAVLGNLLPRDVAADLASGRTPAGLLLLLGGFVFVALGVMVAAQLLQGRDPLGMIGPVRVAARQFLAVFRLLVLIGAAILLLPPYDVGPPMQANLDPVTWVMLLPVSLLAVLVQTGTEELLFRGYFQQSLAARFRSPIIWMGVPSIVFALGHYVPAQAGENALLIAAWAGAFGLLMADLTARAGTLGPAIAVHMFNNCVAILFVSMPDGLSGLSLYLMPFEMSDTGVLRLWLGVDFAMMLICWLAARIAIRR